MNQPVTDTPIRVNMEHVTVAFSGIPVVKDVSLGFAAGEVHVLAGENGAGKSTLMRALAGVHPPSIGQIRIDGDTAELRSVKHARERGIAIIHQELALAPNLTVADNIVFGQEPTRWFGLDRRAATREAQRLLALVGADFPASRRVERLSVGQQQLVEIARALGEEPRVLIFDEPTAALSESEERKLMEIVKNLRNQGLAIIYITHRMKEIQELADRVSVLRDGRLVTTLDAAEATPEKIVTLMVGRPIETLFGDTRHEPEAVALEVRDLSGPGVDSATFTVRSGEVVGMAGLIGAGRTEVARLLYGADRRTHGTVRLNGKDIAPRSPIDALAAGIVMLPESRKEQGLFLDRSVAENICVSLLPSISLAGFIRTRKLRKLAKKYVDLLSIRCSSIDQPARELSGGNQQKLLLARCLSQEPTLLILDEPTRGVDIGARSEIYGVINDIAATGVAILLISSELPEVIGISNRVLVMREGRILADITKDDLTEDAVMGYASGLRTQTTPHHDSASIPSKEGHS